ncbi:MAG: hypothetical protein AAFW81_07505 [Pseudomonadota bacterium]
MMASITRIPSQFGAIALAVIAGCGALAASADAQSLKDARARDAAEKALAQEAAYTSRVCGREIDAAIDWRSAADWPADLLLEECNQSLSALETACRSGAAPAQAVSFFVCAGDGSGPSLRRSTLRYGAGRGEPFGDTLEALGG